MTMPDYEWVEDAPCPNCGADLKRTYHPPDDRPGCIAILTIECPTKDCPGPMKPSEALLLGMPVIVIKDLKVDE